MARVAQVLLLIGLLVGAWWVGARSAQAQMFVLSSTAAALLFAAISASINGNSSSSLSKAGTISVILMLLFLGMQAIRIVNPAFSVKMDGAYWHLVPLIHYRFLPTGFNGPFDGLAEGNLAFTNPLRHLIVFSAAFCATVTVFLVSRTNAIRRGIVGAFVIQAAAVSIVSIFHRLSGATKTLWFHEEIEFWSGSAIFPYKNSAAAYQVILCGCCLAMFRAEGERRNRKPFLIWTIGIVTALSFIALFSLNSRAGIGMGIGLLTIAFYQEVWAARSNGTPATSPLRKIAAITTIGVLAVWLVAQSGFETTLRRFTSDKLTASSVLRGGSARILKQDIAVEMAKDNFWTGWGGGCYLPLFLTYHPKIPAYLVDLLGVQPDRNRIYETSADGDWWEFLAEYGATGVSLLLGIVALITIVWFRSDGLKCKSSIYMMLTAHFVIFHGTIDRILRDQIVLSMLGVAFALAIRTAQHSSELGSNLTRRQRF